ncbi:uncharacterized protein DUF2516 [Prauserella shujinwangii]|uniref:Uncharacterized protein DUF2516 n=1 Tax=Prauserella shujinwangii TaxID=1453103 RepID=A0A2T0LQG4_9PSEU|nr:uncharacterized protein DUF2516 [Prauserella shujinwangii]
MSGPLRTRAVRNGPLMTSGPAGTRHGLTYPGVVPLIAQWIVWVIDWAGTLVGVFAFVHALTQRADAYAAADRKTKPVWLAITGGSTVALALFGYYGAGMIFWLAGLVAVLVYIVDVRPKLIEVQRGGQY